MVAVLIVMTRKRLPLQQDLISDVWRISLARKDVELLLDHIIRLQSQAIALAVAYGAKQTELATLAQVSRQRIGQIVDETDVSGILPSTLRRQVDQTTEWPQDTMSDLRTLQSPRDQDDPERREVLRKQTAVASNYDLEELAELPNGHAGDGWANGLVHCWPECCASRPLDRKSCRESDH